MNFAVKERKPAGVIRRGVSLALAFLVGIGAGIAVCVLDIFGGQNDEIDVLNVDTTIVEEEYTLTIENVEELVKPASELVSIKYYYKDANTYENVVSAFGVTLPFTTDKVVFTYEGIVSLGIDLEKVAFDVDNTRKVILVTLPEVEIMHNEIDANSFEYPYTSNSIFNTTGMEEYVNLIDTLQTEKAKEVMQDERLLADALERAQETLINILSVADVSMEYTVEFA